MGMSNQKRIKPLLRQVYLFLWKIVEGANQTELGYHQRLFQLNACSSGSGTMIPTRLTRDDSVRKRLKKSATQNHTLVVNETASTYMNGHQRGLGQDVRSNNDSRPDPDLSS